MTQFAGVYLATVLVGLVISFVEQAFLPRFVSKHTAWGLAPGWQREIAFWNVALAVVIAGGLWSKDPSFVSVVVTAVVVLTGLLGTNHLLAALANRSAWLHRVGAIVNYLAALAGVMVLRA
jgi:hypothetical protein